MPAVGQETGNRYLECEILEPQRHKVMSDEPLYRVLADGVETDVLVCAVRNEKRPHFRQLRDKKNDNDVVTKPLERAYERREQNPTHNKCIDSLVELLHRYRLKVRTNTFNDEGKMDPFGQVIFSQGKFDYDWWKDSGACRMPAELGAYIQPDICGSSRGTLFPTAKQKNVVIEVINTHPPEFETFCTLLNYSIYHHAVFFYYVSDRSNGSKYSDYKVEDDVLKLRVSHYLLDGDAHSNGETLPRRGRNEREWYDFLMVYFFGTPLKNK